jgi:hypothetical protein
LAQAEGPDDAEAALMTFADMVKLTLRPGEQLRLISGPPPLDKSLIGKTAVVRIVDVGWCAGTVVRASSSANVKSYNFAVRFDADDIMEWARYVGITTACAENAWGGLDKALASSWSLYGVSVLPRAPGGRFALTDAAREAVAARALLLRPAPVLPPAADGLPRSTAPTRVSEPPAPLQALRASATARPLRTTGAGTAAAAPSHTAATAAEYGVSEASLHVLAHVLNMILGADKDECSVEDLAQQMRDCGHPLQPGHVKLLRSGTAPSSETASPTRCDWRPRTRSRAVMRLQTQASLPVRAAGRRTGASPRRLCALHARGMPARAAGRLRCVRVRRCPAALPRARECSTS